MKIEELKFDNNYPCDNCQKEHKDYTFKEKVRIPYHDVLIYECGLCQSSMVIYIRDAESTTLTFHIKNFTKKK